MGAFLTVTALTLGLACGLAPGLARAQASAPNWPNTTLDADTMRPRDRGESPTPAAYAADVQQAERLGGLLRDAVQADAAAPSTEHEGIRRRAEALALPGCTDWTRRAYFIADAASAQQPRPLVYLLAWSRPAQAIVAGRHYRLGVAGDGQTFDSIAESSKACVAAPWHPPEFEGAVHFTQLTACAPNEYHVFLSLHYRLAIVVGNSVGNWRVDAGKVTFLSERARPCLATPISALVNQWIVLRNPGMPADAYLLAYAYIDWQAGFSLRAGGSLHVDAQGRYSKVADRLTENAERAPMTIRLVDREGRAAYGVAAALPAEALRDLGLKNPPDWLSAYGGPDDPVQLAIRRGSYFNRIGDSTGALAYLEDAYAKSPSAPRLLFELSYAYNAVGLFDAAHRLLSAAGSATSRDVDLCRELAFAMRRTQRLKESAEQYRHCFMLTPEADTVLRIQVAANLAGVYGELGSQAQCDVWRDKAADLAARLPEGKRPGWLDAALQPCVR